ncbi:DUF4283 domain-containing protein/zf-CCHC_4 domain-containing protein [Cephalotus follicularis]|uniref:DUF4283 domain-containing protein/zf-CCHC_4 domain-containing protein n=1 Tax=Cephalotus follicularis TaxID=3775 RepID=A0A1Q3D4K6_CEPFO|nr:DUF4283 domain-containing protein/zf-CCHC_4 domain-containing protein [Cephalotus follicularis]
MSLTLEDCKLTLMWVKLSRVPVQYWTKLGLSHIASVLGKPLHMDLNTIKRHALNFAQVCVDMAANSTFPDNTILELEDGNTTTIGVEYPWRPTSCTLCKVFNHSNKTCPREVQREWLPKLVVMAQRKPEDVEGWITVKRKSNPTEQVHVLAQLELHPVDVEQGGGEDIAKQAAKMPIKSAPAAVDLSTTSPVEGGGMAREDGEIGCYAERIWDTSKVLLIGSSSNHKKKKKKGQGGQGVLFKKSSK